MTDPPALPDADLLAVIAAWEAGRAERWASVSNQKGAAYEDAYARYMIEKTAAEAVLDEARRRGLRRRGQPRSPSAAARVRLDSFRVVATRRRPQELDVAAVPGHQVLGTRTEQPRCSYLLSGGGLPCAPPGI